MRRSIGLAAVGIILTALLMASNAAEAVTSTADLGGMTAADLAQTLAGSGVTVSNVTFTGADTQAGTFVSDEATVGFAGGVVLSSGNIADTVGPNTADGTGTAFQSPGDPDLEVISGFTTFDAAVLEFDFTADAETIFFRYVFSSEEYNEFVNSPFNDSFAFFVNGMNCATVDVEGVSTPITINTINNGNPYGQVESATNPAFFRNNDLGDGGGSINTEMDGLTIVLTCLAAVEPAPAVNHMKLAIADASDTILDSAVFLEQGSLSTTPPGQGAKVTGGGRLDVPGGRVTFGGVVINDEQGPRGNLQVNDHRDRSRFHGTTVDSLVVDLETSTATWTGEGRLNGEDGYRFTATVVDNRNGSSAKKGVPDTVTLEITDGDGAVVWFIDTTDLTRGNLKVHQ